NPKAAGHSRDPSAGTLDATKTPQRVTRTQPSGQYALVLDSSTGVPMSTEANKAIVRAFVDAWSTKSFDRFDDLMADGARLTVGGATIDCSGPATRSIAEHWIG